MSPRLVLLACVTLLLGCRGGEGPGTTGAAGAEGGRPEAADARGGAGSSAAASEVDPEARSRDGPSILFFGTSLTAGLGLDDPGQSFPARVRQKLDSAGLNYRVVEAGVPGETSAAALRRIGWILDERPVEVVVLEEGGNDGLRGQDPDALRRNLAALVDTVRARRPGAAVVLAGMEAPPNLGERYTREFRRAYREVAEEKDVILLPFLLEGVAGDTALNQGDRIHPNARGHRLVAENVWEVLEPVLRRRAEGADG